MQDCEIHFFNFVRFELHSYKRGDFLFIIMAARDEIAREGKVKSSGFTYFHSGHDTARELGTSLLVQDDLLLPSVVESWKLAAI